MKFKKIIFLTLMFIFFFFFFCYEDSEKTDFDITKIIDSYNNSPYISALSELGITVHAKQNDNLFILTYNDNDSITYTYDESEGVLSTSYPFTDNANYDILNAIFVDTISNIQGNVYGTQLPYCFNDFFCYSLLKDSGIAKNYISDESGSLLVDFKINPFITLPTPKDNSPIQDFTFLLEAQTFYYDENCLVKDNGLIFYKTFTDDGIMELYIGQLGELDSYAYESILNAVSILANSSGADSKKVITYFKQNYEGFQNGDTEFDGVTIDTSITELPIKNVDTVLVGNDMKYAKFSIDRDVVKEKSADIVISQPSTEDSVSIGTKAVSAVMIVYIVLIAFVVISLGIIIVKKFKNKD